MSAERVKPNSSVLRALLKSRNKTLKSVIQESGLSESTVNRILDEDTPVKADTFYDFVATLGVNPDWFHHESITPRINEIRHSFAENDSINPRIVNFKPFKNIISDKYLNSELFFHYDLPFDEDQQVIRECEELGLALTECYGKAQTFQNKFSHDQAFKRFSLRKKVNDIADVLDQLEVWFYAGMWITWEFREETFDIEHGSHSNVYWSTISNLGFLITRAFIEPRICVLVPGSKEPPIHRKYMNENHYIDGQEIRYQDNPWASAHSDDIFL